MTIALLALALGQRLGASAAGTGSILSADSRRPGDITVGSDGNLWFPEMGTNRIGRITIAGAVQEFTIPGASALGRAIATGPDGRLWVLGSGVDGLVHVWAVDTSGPANEIASLGENPVLGIGFLPAGMTAGPDGNVWISELSAIARVSAAGQVTEFPTGSGAVPTSITAGPDSHLWFVTSIGFIASRQGLSRITTEGLIEEVLQIQDRQGLSTPSSIITGPQGSLWFADNGYSEIVRVELNPVRRTAFPFVGPSGLAAGPDGNIWITVPGRRAIARLTPSGVFTEFGLPTPQSDSLGIVAGPDGNLWFTEPEHGAIGRITPDGVVTEFALGRAVHVPLRSPRSPRSIRSR